MSMLDNITDEALLGDDDELDYDLEKDEEDALLADPDNYDENNYEDVPEDHDETVDEQYDGQGGAEEESDVLDIDVNVALEEVEEDNNDQACVKQESFEATMCKTEVDDGASDAEHEEQKARDRFLNERNNVIKRSNTNGIPDTLDKVNVKPPPLLDNRNLKFQRGNRGRGRGRGNHGRGSVFGRVGTLPQEGKKVLINPHFRGNVQVNENARLVWDANNPNGHYQSQQQPQRGYGNPQMAHVAPFQSQFNQNPPSPWLNPPFAVDAANNNNNGGNGSFGSSPASSMHHQAHANFAEPPGNYGPPPELLNNGIRPLMGPNSMPFNQQHHHNQAQQPLQQQQQQPQMTSWNEDQCYGAEPVYPAQVGNFRGREVRYLQPLLAAPTFNNQQPLPLHQQHQQQTHFQQHGRNNFNNTFNNDTNHPPPQPQQQTPPRRHVKPYINPNHPQAAMVPQSNYHQPHFDQPPPYIQQQQQQQFPANQQHLLNHSPFQHNHQQQQQQQQPPPTPPAFNQPPTMYDSYDTHSSHGFNGNNQYHHQFQPQSNQNQPNNGFPPSNNYQQHGFENNYNNSQQQGQFNQQPQQHYNNNNNRHTFGQNNRVQNNHHHQQQQQQQRQNNRQQMNNYNSTAVNRSPPKRRSFENNQGQGDRDGPKKKMRSMEPSNLHEVPTVDMPDTTTEDKTESEDEETKAYRLKIEEQKKKREEFLRAKEERRKMAAAQRAEGGESLLGDAPESSADISVPISTIKPKLVNTATVKQQQPQPLLKQPVQLQQAQPVARQQQQRVRPQGQQAFRAQPPGLIQLPAHLQQQQQGFKQQAFRQQGPQQQRPLQRVNTQQQAARRIPVQQQQRPNNQRNNLRNVPQQQQPRRLVQPANIVVTQKNEQQQQRVVLLKQPPAQQQKMQNSNRRVVLKGVQQQQQQQQDGSEQENLSSFLSNRKVVTNSSVLAGDGVSGGVSVVGVAGNTAAVTAAAGGGGAALIETPVVVVSNLAAGTTDLKIRKLCQGLGPIQNIELIPNSRQATIRFKNIVSAHKFFKKYQRKIVDLSMIQVCLLAES